MSSRMIGIATALVVAVAIAGISYIGFGPAISQPADIESPPGDTGGTPVQGSLSSNQLIDFWRVRVERDPRDYISLTELAGAFIRNARETGDVSNYGRADEALKRALELNPDYQGSLTYQASLFYARHDFEGALRAAERIHSFDPNAVHAIAVAGDARLELGRYSEAQSDYDRLFKLSQTAPVLSRLAHLKELKGEPSTAIALMSDAVAQADEEQAATETRAWYRSQLARLYFSTGDLESAGGQYEASLDIFPGYVHAQAGLARVAAARGEYEEAIELYEQVVERQPVLEYVVALGDVYSAAGSSIEAERQYHLVAAIETLYRANGINTDLEIASFLTDHPAEGRIGEAVAQARAAYEAQPGNIRAADVLSWALYRAGLHGEALKYSNEALRLGTRDPLLYFHAGMINQALSNGDTARDLLSLALEINPAFSVFHSSEAAATLEALKISVRR